jgi:hypothetical protein
MAQVVERHNPETLAEADKRGTGKNIHIFYVLTSLGNVSVTADRAP